MPRYTPYKKQPGDLTYEFPSSEAAREEAAKAGQPMPEKLQVWGKDQLNSRAHNRVLQAVLMAPAEGRDYRLVMARETMMEWLAHDETHWNLQDDEGKELPMDERTIDALWFDTDDSDGLGLFLTQKIWKESLPPEEAAKNSNGQPGGESESKNSRKASKSETAEATRSSRNASTPSNSVETDSQPSPSQAA